MSELIEHTCETDGKNIQEFVLNWKAKNVSSEEHKMCSEVFDIELDQSTKSSVKIQLFLDRAYYDPNMSAWTSLIISVKNKIKGNFKIIPVSCNANKTLTMKPLNESLHSYTISNINWKVCPESDGTYMIQCRITVLKLNSDFENTKTKTPILNADNSLTSSIISDLENLLINKSFSDLKCVSEEGKEFAVHKCVLASRCPYFERALQDLTTKRITIPVSSEISEEVLKYIYTGKTPNVKTMCLPLLEAALKLELKDLISLCEAVVISQLTIEDAPKTLILADDYSMVALTEEVINFIVENAEEVGKLPFWREMMKTHPHLISEVTFQLQVANSKK